MSDDLDVLANQVRTCLKKSDDYKTTAGAHLRAAREICRTNGTEFMEWCRGQDFGIGKSQIYRLMDGTSTGNVERAAKSPMGDADIAAWAWAEAVKGSRDADQEEGPASPAGDDDLTADRVVAWFNGLPTGEQTAVFDRLVFKAVPEAVASEPKTAPPAAVEAPTSRYKPAAVATQSGKYSAEELATLGIICRTHGGACVQSHCRYNGKCTSTGGPDTAIAAAFANAPSQVSA